MVQRELQVLDRLAVASELDLDVAEVAGDVIALLQLPRALISLVAFHIAPCAVVLFAPLEQLCSLAGVGGAGCVGLGAGRLCGGEQEQKR